MTFTAIIEPTNTGYSGYIVDLGGQIIAAGDTVDEVTNLLQEATEQLFRDLRTEGKPVPQPATLVRQLHIA
jgi:predicted RNase H-like HicB family nuclease